MPNYTNPTWLLVFEALVDFARSQGEAEEIANKVMRALRNADALKDDR